MATPVNMVNMDSIRKSLEATVSRLPEVSNEELTTASLIARCVQADDHKHKLEVPQLYPRYFYIYLFTYRSPEHGSASILLRRKGMSIQ